MKERDTPTFLSEDGLRSFYAAQQERLRTSRSRNTLSRIWMSLERIRASGLTDFSVPKVCSVLGELGFAMAPQSIYNERGAIYRDLIRAYGRVYVSGRERDKSQTPLEKLLEAIPDMGARAIIRENLRLLARLERENSVLRSSLKEFEIPSSTGKVERGVANATMPLDDQARFRSEAKLTTAEREALVKSLDSERLEERGLVLEADGSISLGSTIMFPPRFVDAVRKVLSTLASS